MSIQTKCPFCAEEIEPAASTCPHCGERLDDALGPPRSKSGSFDSFAFGASGGGGRSPAVPNRFSQQNVIIAAGVALVVAVAAVLLVSRHSSPPPVQVTAPRFTSTENTPDGQAQARLRIAIVAAKTIYTD